MCEVIALTPRPAPRFAPAGGSAEILFFMGVRYHRMSDEDFERATARKPAEMAAKAPAKAPTKAKASRPARKRA